MKKLFLVICVLSTFIFTGCTSAKIYHLNDEFGSYYEKSYELNKPYTISVGETVLSINGVANGAAITYPRLVSSEDIEIKSTAFTTFDNYGVQRNYSIKKNEVLTTVAQASYQGEDYYLINASPNRRHLKNTVKERLILVNKKTLMIYPRIGFHGETSNFLLSKGYTFSKDSAKFIELESHYEVKNPKDEINFNIVYNGISGDTLRLAYREFTANDLARPAFFQDLTYNKNEKIIKFRGIDIEILKVTNNELTYKISQDGMKTTIGKK